VPGFLYPLHQWLRKGGSGINQAVKDRLICYPIAETLHDDAARVRLGVLQARDLYDDDVFTPALGAVDAVLLLFWQFATIGLTAARAFVVRRRIFALDRVAFIVERGQTVNTVPHCGIHLAVAAKQEDDLRFVVIAGPSGSGKSSLVRAGLIHALKQGALSKSDRWLYATLTPGRDPIESLALAMSRMAKSPDAGDYVRVHKAEVNALHKFSESLLSDRKDQRAVIFADQFEEVFTQVSKEDERVAFLNLLIHAATTEGSRVTALFAMRSDFVSNCAMYPQLNALLNQQFVQVGAMQPDELVSAIARPALQVGLSVVDCDHLIKAFLGCACAVA
jgi:hypothetical protein